MTNQQEWSEFINHLCSHAVDGHRNSQEYEYIQQQREQIGEMLTTNLTLDQKEVVDEMLFDLGMIAERETEVVYRQGLSDCVLLLKNLGVLA